MLQEIFKRCGRLSSSTSSFIDLNNIAILKFNSRIYNKSYNMCERRINNMRDLKLWINGNKLTHQGCIIKPLHGKEIMLCSADKMYDLLNIASILAMFTDVEYIELKINPELYERNKNEVLSIILNKFIVGSISYIDITKDGIVESKIRELMKLDFSLLTELIK